MTKPLLKKWNILSGLKYTFLYNKDFEIASRVPLAFWPYGS